MKPHLIIKKHHKVRNTLILGTVIVTASVLLSKLTNKSSKEA